MFIYNTSGLKRLHVRPQVPALYGKALKINFRRKENLQVRYDPDIQQLIWTETHRTNIETTALIVKTTNNITPNFYVEN